VEYIFCVVFDALARSEEYLFKKKNAAARWPFTRSRRNFCPRAYGRNKASGPAVFTLTAHRKLLDGIVVLCLVYPVDGMTLQSSYSNTVFISKCYQSHERTIIHITLGAIPHAINLFV
jgi:hypothetical protein